MKSNASWHKRPHGHCNGVRFAVALICLATYAHSADVARPAPAPALAADELPNPAAPGATGPSLATGPDGRVWLSWLERGPGAETALRFSLFDASTKRWSPARNVGRGSNWFVNWADFPALSPGPEGHVTAVWFVNNPAAPRGAAAHGHDGPGYRAMISRTADAGETWSAPIPLTRESTSVEFVSLATLADGRVLAAWLDGRAKQGGGKSQQLYARVLGSTEPDTLVDSSVCDCCSTTLTSFLDGSALLAYRGRTNDEVRDIRVARFRSGGWEEPRALNHDDWRIAGCPVNGPQIASDGGRVAAAWFTAADNDPRVLISFSPDAGARFLMPLRLDTAKPAGRVDTLLLRDAAMLASWVSADGAVVMRRVSPDFVLGESLQLAPAAPGRMKSVTRMALVRDFAGGMISAQLLVAFVEEGAAAGVRTLLVSVPEGELLAAEKNCDCSPTAEQLQGFAIRGTMVEARPVDGFVRVRHPELPGIFSAGTHDFKVARDTIASNQSGRSFLGRIEQRAGAWWLFDVRFIATPQ